MWGALGCFSYDKCTWSLHAPRMALWLKSLSTTYCTVINMLLLFGCMRHSWVQNVFSQNKDSIALVVIGVCDQKRGWVKSYDTLFQEFKCSEYSNIWAYVLFFSINPYSDKLVICTIQSKEWYWKFNTNCQVLVDS